MCTLSRFRFIGGQILSISAAFLVAFPLTFQNLHLATDHQRHRSCNSDHCNHVKSQCSFHSHINKVSLLILPHPEKKNKSDKEHIFATCPICQAFTALSNGVWFSTFQSPTVIDSKPHLSFFLSDQFIPETFLFSSGLPRAPPCG